MSSYVFEGELIKLNERDFNKMQTMYQNINLRAELDQLDFELRGTKKWWPVMNAKLNYRNKVSPQRQKYVTQGNVAAINNRSTREMTLDEELSDRSWAK